MHRCGRLDAKIDVNQEFCLRVLLLPRMIHARAFYIQPRSVLVNGTRMRIGEIEPLKKPRSTQTKNEPEGSSSC